MEIENQRHRFIKIILAIALCFTLYRWYNGVLLFQIANSPLFDISLDNTFWLFHYTGLPNFFIQKPVLLIILEFALIAIGILVFRKPKPIFCLLFLILYIFVSMLLQTYTATLMKLSVVFPIVFLPFCLPYKYFPFGWKLPRYYVAFLMVSAGLFKIINGGLFNMDQMSTILFNQHMDLTYFDNNHVANLVLKLLANKWIAFIGFVVVAIVELSFVVLVFTRKYDRYLLMVLLLFATLIYSTMRIYTLDIFYLALPLLSFVDKKD